jgi:hypothetical protein
VRQRKRRIFVWLGARLALSVFVQLLDKVVAEKTTDGNPVARSGLGADSKRQRERIVGNTGSRRSANKMKIVLLGGSSRDLSKVFAESALSISSG